MHGSPLLLNDSLDMVHNCRVTELPHILDGDFYIASQVAAASSNITASLANFSSCHFKDILKIIVSFLNPLNHCIILPKLLQWVS